MSSTAGFEGWLFVIVVMGLVLTRLTGLEPAISFQIGILVLLVVLLGLPHGALDIEVGRLTGLWDDRASLLAFGGLYLLLVGLAAGFWVAAPAAALVLFLIISVWHFAEDWRTELPLALRLSVSASLIAAPALVHQAEVEVLFGLLAPADHAARVADTLGSIAVFLIASAALAAVMARHLRTRAEIVCLVLAAVVLPPLLTFIAYFCFLHSPRHLRLVCRELEIVSVSDLVRRAGPIVALTLGLACAASLLLPAASPSAMAMRIVFVGLFALTVPHMLLIDLWGRSEQARGEPAQR